MKKLLIALACVLGAVQLHAQGCSSNLYLSTFETTTPVVHQASVTVIGGSGYGVSGSYDATLRAGELVELKDGAHIKNGSLFLAEIGPCTKAKSANNSVADALAFSAYPNPVGSTLNLAAANSEITKITVTTLDGRVIVNREVKSETTAQLDFAAFPAGIYMLTVNTADGNIFQEKIVKN